MKKAHGVTRILADSSYPGALIIKVFLILIFFATWASEHLFVPFKRDQNEPENVASAHPDPRKLIDTHGFRMFQVIFFVVFLA